ncbi:hypothetical protein ACLKA6_006237 [Drosophila palustris]
MHQGTEDADEDNGCNSHSMESTDSSVHLSAESDGDEVTDEERVHQWKKEHTVDRYSRPYQLPDIQYNSLAEVSVRSLGYAAPEDWPSSCSVQEREKKPPLYELLLGLIQRSLKTNTVVTIAQSSLPVHLIVLQCFSGLFCDLNNDMSVELPVEWVTPRAFRLIYDWMLEDAPRLARLGLLEVLRAARFLKIPQLERQCEDCLAHGFTEDSAVLLYLEARLLHMERAHRPLLQSVGRFFLTLVATQEFLQLPAQALWQLLRSNSIGVNTELEVFMSAVRWLNFQWPKRRLIVGQLMSCVRFGLVPPWLLIRLHDRPSNSAELRRITSHPEVLQQLHDGIGYTTTRLCYGSDRDAFMLHLERSGMQPPVQRSWIYDPACSYHHRLHCQISEEFTYEAFTGYLNLLQTLHRDYWQSLQPVDASEECVCCQRTAKPTEMEGSFLNILALSVLAVIWRNPEMMDELESGSHDFTVDLNAPALPTPLSKVDPPYAYRDHSLNYQNFDMGGLVCTCMIAITLMMIYGTIKGKPSHLLPFFCLQLFDFAITTLTAAGYLCYLQGIHRLISQSHRLPWRENLLKLPQEELVIVVLVVFVCIVFLKAYCIGIVWRCYKYLTLRQQHLRSLLPCVMSDTMLHGGLGGGGFGAEERAYSTLLPNYDEAIAQYLKQAPPPSYQVAMSNYHNEDEGAAGGAQSAADAGGSTPLFVALDAVAVNAASNTDDTLDNNNDVPNNNNTVHVNANTPPMRRSEQAASNAASASASDDDNADNDNEDDLEIIDAGVDIMEGHLPPPPPPYNDVSDAQVQMPSPSRLSRQVDIPGQVPARNESQA